MSVKIDIGAAKPAISGEGFTLANDTYTLLDGADVVLTGNNKKTQRRVEVAKKAQVKITLENAVIEVFDKPAIECWHDSVVTVTLVGDNSLSSSGGKGGGISALGFTKLTVNGEGSLTAIGGNSGGSGIQADELAIDGGNIKALAVYYNTAIRAERLTINKGEIFAGGLQKKGYPFGPTGINAKSITINGGAVTAEAARTAAAIGGENITINGGTVTATILKNGLGAAIGGTVASVGGKGTSGATVEINGGTVRAINNEKKAGAGIGGGTDALNCGTLIMNGNATVFTSSLVHYYQDRNASKPEAVKTNTDGVKSGTLYVGNEG